MGAPRIERGTFRILCSKIFSLLLSQLSYAPYILQLLGSLIICISSQQLLTDNRPEKVPKPLLSISGCVVVYHQALDRSNVNLAEATGKVRCSG